MVEVSYEFDPTLKQVTFKFREAPQNIMVSYETDVDLGEFVKRLISLIDQEQLLQIVPPPLDDTLSDKEKIINDTIKSIVKKFNDTITPKNIDNNVSSEV